MSQKREEIVSHHVLAKIGREEADPQSAGRSLERERRDLGLEGSGMELAPTVQLQSQHRRTRRRIKEHRVDQITMSDVVGRIEVERAPEAGDAFLQPSLFAQGQTKIIQNARSLGPLAQRRFIAYHRL